MVNGLVKEAFMPHHIPNKANTDVITEESK